MRSDTRAGGRVGIVVAATMGLALAWLVVLPRVFRRNRDRMLKIGPVKKAITKYNDMARNISGSPRSSRGLLTHVGRRSGLSYQTSLGTCSYGDGFLLPLGYGPRTDWYRNLMAAGTGTLTWKGHNFQLERPELISGPDAMQVWRMPERILLRLAGIHDFMWLHAVTDQAETSPPDESALEHTSR